MQVGKASALWAGAVMTFDDAGNELGWDRSMTVLTWTDGAVGYRLQAKGLDLENPAAGGRVAELTTP